MSLVLFVEIDSTVAENHLLSVQKSIRLVEQVQVISITSVKVKARNLLWINILSLLLKNTMHSMSNITPITWKIFLLPIKKPITTSTGIILEEDKGELLTDTYEVMFMYSKDFSVVLNAGDRVICSDMSGTNIIVQGTMMKVVDYEHILGTIS